MLANGVQWSLLQPADEHMPGPSVLFAAWPCDWDVSFKLHGPHNTVVTAVFAAGQLQSLEFSPASAKSDYVVMPCQVTAAGGVERQRP